MPDPGTDNARKFPAVAQGEGGRGGGGKWAHDLFNQHELNYYIYSICFSCNW